MTTPQPARRLRAGDADRDRVLDALQEAHQAGRLDVEELHERQDRALRAVWTDDLTPLLADLPEGRELERFEDRAPARRSAQRLPATAPADGGFTLTVMSGKDVVVEPGTESLGDFAWWGGNTYDLTRALGPGRTVTLDLNAVMAGHDIVVPQGVRIIDRSMAIMAGNDIHRGAQGDGSGGTLVLKGFLWWAGHDVKLARDTD